MYVCIFLFILISVLLVLIVLIQKGRGGGLSGAFGGGGGGGTTAFGSKTGDVLTWATSIIFGVFLVLAVSLNWLADWRESQRVAGLAAPTVQTTPDNTPAADGNAPSGNGAPSDSAPAESK
jgi:preprotein translocase subunit SecG